MLTSAELKKAKKEGVIFYHYSMAEFPEKVMIYRNEILSDEKEVVGEFYGLTKRIHAFIFLKLMNNSSPKVSKKVIK